MTSAAKQHTLELAERYVCPDRVRVMSGGGIDLVMGSARGTGSGTSTATSSSTST